MGNNRNTEIVIHSSNYGLEERLTWKQTKIINCNFFVNAENYILQKHCLSLVCNVPEYIYKLYMYYCVNFRSNKKCINIKHLHYF